MNFLGPHNPAPLQLVERGLAGRVALVENEGAARLLAAVALSLVLWSFDPRCLKTRVKVVCQYGEALGRVPRVICLDGVADVVG